MPFYSPLRYPGGKGRLGAWMADVMRANRLTGGWYAEPYVGGAGVALHLLLGGYVRRIYINDIDPTVYAFWRAVLDWPEDLLKRLRETPVTVEERDRQADILSSPDQHSVSAVGFATLFVNRTSRSGILTGGVIGGRSQAGKWKINARFNRKALFDRINLISQYSNRINLSNLDALDFLNKLPKQEKRSGLVYLDPPYFSKGSDLYQNAYIDKDHESIAKYVRDLDTPWIVTYDDVPEIERMYEWANGGRFKIYYTANDISRRHATELIYCKGLKLDPRPYSKR